MKTLLLLLLACSPLLGAAQKTKQELHVKNIECQYDTLSWVYANSEVKVENETTKEIVITEGAKKVLFLKYFTTSCECNDCSEYHHIALTIDSLQKNEVRYLKADDVKWVYGNSWTDSKYITTYLGHITMIDEKHYEIKISELLGSSIIRTLNFSVHTGQ